MSYTFTANGTTIYQNSTGISGEYSTIEEARHELEKFAEKHSKHENIPVIRTDTSEPGNFLYLDENSQNLKKIRNIAGTRKVFWEIFIEAKKLKIRPLHTI